MILTTGDGVQVSDCLVDCRLVDKPRADCQFQVPLAAGSLSIVSTPALLHAPPAHAACAGAVGNVGQRLMSGIALVLGEVV